MSKCPQCGIPVQFRVVEGRTIPFGCRCFKPSSEAARERVRHSDDSKCHRTKCPSCGAPVYFIRHNGGSAWIEPPLGPPWDRHPCFGIRYSNDETLSPPFASTKLVAQLGGRSVTTGVIVRTEINGSRSQTYLEIAIGRATALTLLVRGGADAWIGELVVISHDERKVYQACNPNYCFIILAEQAASPFEAIVADDSLTEKQRLLLRRYRENGFGVKWKTADMAHLIPLLTGKDQDQAAHTAALSILEHAERYGDYQKALPLVMSLPLAKRERLIRWFHQFSPISIDLHRKEHKTYIFRTASGKRRLFRITEARATPI